MLITVPLMLSVPTLLVASPAPVTRDTLEMALAVKVGADTYLINAPLVMSIL